MNAVRHVSGSATVPVAALGVSPNAFPSPRETRCPAGEPPALPIAGDAMNPDESRVTVVATPPPGRVAECGAVKRNGAIGNLLADGQSALSPAAPLNAAARDGGRDAHQGGAQSAGGEMQPAGAILPGALAVCQDPRVRVAFGNQFLRFRFTGINE